MPHDAGRRLQLGALGSGSDYTPFLQHLGVMPWINVGFGGEADYGVYHSAYDTFEHFHRFVDPEIRIRRGARQVAGRVVLRAAQAELIPADEADFAASIAGYDEELHKMVDGMRSKPKELGKLLDDGRSARRRSR
jgi:N-acetylated-alpha-linked acidic dipeptidase